MRLSDLKKKLLLLVGVIAAFALLGSMMLPSISEKMGLDADSCFASPPADGAYDYYDEYEWDPYEAEADCFAAAEARLKRALLVVKILCKSISKGNEERNKVCYEAARAILESNYLDEVNDCIDMYNENMEYPDTPPWERP